MMRTFEPGPAPATPTHVLIIGVDDYSIFDASAGLPIGRSHLRGARNDARLWYRVMRRHLGVPADQIMVLGAPKFAPEDLGLGATEDTVGLADHQGICDGIKHLGGLLQDPARNGVLIFSGHGALVSGQSLADQEQGMALALCPSDTTSAGGDLAKHISLREVERWMRRHDHKPAGSNLTLILDTCYSERGPGVRSLTPATAAGQPPPPALQAFDRVMLASAQWQTAEEIHTGMGWHGGFSFALATLMMQWRVVHRRGVATVNVSYGDLVYRTREMARLLGLKQTPRLSGRRTLDDLPLFYLGEDAPLGLTSPEPDAPRFDEQLWPDTNGFVIYKIELQTDSMSYTLAGVVSRASGSNTKSEVSVNPSLWGVDSVSSGTELWYLDPVGISAFSASTQPVTALTVTIEKVFSGPGAFNHLSDCEKKKALPYDGQNPPAVVTQTPPWTQVTALPSGYPYWFADEQQGLGLAVTSSGTLQLAWLQATNGTPQDDLFEGSGSYPQSFSLPLVTTLPSSSSSSPPQWYIATTTVP